MEILFIGLYLGCGVFYFLCSLTRILVFQAGCLYHPTYGPSGSGIYTAITLVTALSLEQLEAHSKCMDFQPGQWTAIVENCANAHIWNRRDQFLSFRPLQSKEQVVSTIGGKTTFSCWYWRCCSFVM